jgi:hypothetical protein
MILRISTVQFQQIPAILLTIEQVIVVPLLDGILGAMIPARTWFGVLMSALGVAMLECSGSPPSVSIAWSFIRISY